MFKATSIQELDDVFKKHNVIPQKYVGAGAYGFVLSVLQMEEYVLLRWRSAQRLMVGLPWKGKWSQFQ